MSKSREQQGSVILLLIILLALVAGAYFYLGKENGLDLINQAKNLLPAGDSQAGSTDTTPESEAEIVITKNGFVPATITVAKGQQVTWVNTDNSSHQVISQQAQLQGEILAPTDSFSYAFEDSGTFTVRDRLNLLGFSGGTIIVK